MYWGVFFLSFMFGAYQMLCGWVVAWETESNMRRTQQYESGKAPLALLQGLILGMCAFLAYLSFDELLPVVGCVAIVTVVTVVTWHATRRSIEDYWKELQLPINP